MDVGVIVGDGNVVGWISKKAGVEVEIGGCVAVGIAICVPITSVFANEIPVSITLVVLVSGDEARRLQDINTTAARNCMIFAL